MKTGKKMKGQICHIWYSVVMAFGQFKNSLDTTSLRHQPFQYLLRLWTQTTFALSLFPLLQLATLLLLPREDVIKKLPDPRQQLYSIRGGRRQ